MDKDPAYLVILYTAVRYGRLYCKAEGGWMVTSCITILTGSRSRAALTRLDVPQVQPGCVEWETYPIHHIECAQILQVLK